MSHFNSAQSPLGGVPDAIEWLESSGTAPHHPVFNEAYNEAYNASIEQSRKRRNEKRRLRYAAKHSKKAKLAQLHAAKATLEMENKKLKKELERHRKKQKAK